MCAFAFCVWVGGAQVVGGFRRDPGSGKAHDLDVLLRRPGENRIFRRASAPGASSSRSAPALALDRVPGAGDQVGEPGGGGGGGGGGGEEAADPGWSDGDLSDDDGPRGEAGKFAFRRRGRWLPSGGVRSVLDDFLDRLRDTPATRGGLPLFVEVL